MKKKGILLTVVSTLFIMFCLVMAMPSETEAASSYKEIGLNYDSPSKPVKVGKYYYKYKKGRLYYSKKKSSGYHRTKIDTYGDLWTNGKTIYYTDYNDNDRYVLYKYTISSKKLKKLKTLPYVSGNWYSYWIGKVRGGKVFINLANYAKNQYSVYSYKTKTKKFKREKKNCAIMLNSGEYCLCQKEYHKKGFYPVTWYLYKVTSSGSFKKVKTLTKSGAQKVELINGKFYYMTLSESKHKATLYKMSVNGKSKKKLFTTSYTDLICPSKITTKYCDIVTYEGDFYRYYY